MKKKRAVSGKERRGRRKEGKDRVVFLSLEAGMWCLEELRLSCDRWSSSSSSRAEKVEHSGH